MPWAVTCPRVPTSTLPAKFSNLVLLSLLYASALLFLAVSRKNVAFPKPFLKFFYFFFFTPPRNKKSMSVFCIKVPLVPVRERDVAT